MGLNAEKQYGVLMHDTQCVLIARHLNFVSLSVSHKKVSVSQTY